MKMRVTALMLMAGAAHAAFAIDVSDMRRYVCRQGNCANGQGTVFDGYLSVTMTGNWSRGQTIPGETYTVISPLAPTEKFTQVYGQDGFLEKGDQPRTILANGKNIPYFRGTYGRIDDPFIRARMPVPREGVYYNGIGIEYRGRFEFLPAKSGLHTNVASGYYIFFGERIDTEDDEKESGLYVSDESLTGAPIRFIKADPSYMAKMQATYQRDLQIAETDFREKEAEERWRTVLAIAGKVAYGIATGGASVSNFQRMGAELVMGMVNEQITKQQREMDVRQAALNLARRTAGDDKALSDALSQAVDAGTSSINSK